MKKYFILLIAVILFVLAGGIYIVLQKLGRPDGKSQVWDDRVEAALAAETCPPANRTFKEDEYTGPLIDTHIHIAPIPDGPVDAGETSEDDRPLMGVNVTINDYVCMMNTEGTNKVFGFFAVWEPIEPFLDMAEQAMQTYPDRFVPFIMPPDHDNSLFGSPTVEASELEKMLNAKPDLFRGYGEIGLYARKIGARELPPDSERMRAIYPVVRTHGLIVYVHLGEGQQDSFERALSENPDITFIWHGDQLITGSGREQDLSVVEEILNNHPNARYGVDELYGDIWLIKPGVSKEEFLKHLENREALLEQDVATWKGFIERHPDQVLWGTDRGWSAPWSIDPEVALALNSYSRAFIKRLDPSIQEKFAHENAEKLLHQ